VKRILLVVGTLLAAGLAYEAAAALGDSRRHLPPGAVHRLGEHDVHVHCSGTGGPTVILEAGAMGLSSTWLHVQSHLSDLTRVCSYDRAGYGWSGPRQRPPTLDGGATDLRSLLRTAGEEGPFIVVGHSLGGHHARTFTHMHRGEVVGLVLVDARHPDAASRLPDYENDMAAFTVTARLATVLARLGVMRLLGDVGGSLDGLPDDARAAMLARSTTGRHWATVVREIATLEELDAAVAAQPSFGDLPVLVIAAGVASAGASEATRSVWVAMQEDLVTVSSNARLQVVHGSDHLGLLHHPDHALEVAHGIAQLVPGLRSEPSDPTWSR